MQDPEIIKDNSYEAAEPDSAVNVNMQEDQDEKGQDRLDLAELDFTHQLENDPQSLIIELASLGEQEFVSQVKMAARNSANPVLVIQQMRDFIAQNRVQAEQIHTLKQIHKESLKEVEQPAAKQVAKPAIPAKDTLTSKVESLSIQKPEAELETEQPVALAKIQPDITLKTSFSPVAEKVFTVTVVEKSFEKTIQIATEETSEKTLVNFSAQAPVVEKHTLSEDRFSGIEQLALRNIIETPVVDKSIDTSLVTAKAVADALEKNVAKDTVKIAVKTTPVDVLLQQEQSFIIAETILVDKTPSPLKMVEEVFPETVMLEQKNQQQAQINIPELIVVETVQQQDAEINLQISATVKTPQIVTAPKAPTEKLQDLLVSNEITLVENLVVKPVLEEKQTAVFLQETPEIEIATIPEENNSDAQIADVFGSEQTIPDLLPRREEKTVSIIVAANIQEIVSHLNQASEIMHVIKPEADQAYSVIASNDTMRDFIQNKVEKSKSQASVFANHSIRTIDPQPEISPLNEFHQESEEIAFEEPVKVVPVFQNTTTMDDLYKNGPDFYLQMYATSSNQPAVSQPVQEPVLENQDIVVPTFYPKRFNNVA